MSGGKQFDESSKHTIESFLKAAHAAHWPQAEVTRSLEAYHGMQEARAEQLVALDNAAHQRGEDALRAEWGPEYRANVQRVSNLLAGMPDGLPDLLIGGRLADGTRIGDHPGVIKWLAARAMEDPTLSDAGAGGPSSADRLAEIRKFASENPDAYDKDKGMQAEQQRLIAIQSRAASRAA